MSTIKANNISPIGSTLTLGGSLAGLTVAGGVTVSGAAYFSSGVTLNSALTVNSSATFNGAVTFGSTMTVTGGVTMSSLTKFSNGIQLGTSTLSTPTGSAPLYGCRCFGSILLNMGEGSGFTLLTAGNVASVVRRTSNDNGATTNSGGYRITFGTAMPNANYTVVLGSGRPPTGLAQNVQDDERTSLVYNKTASYFDVYCFNGGNAYYDSSINWAVFA